MQPAVFDEFRKVVYDATGIALGPSKEALVAARVGKRMRTLGLTSYRSYLKRVTRDDSGAEMTQLVDAICTNVTSFFREEDHFGFVREVLLAKRAEGQTRFRIWSAACSTGEEPYSLAIALHQAFSMDPAVDLRILATDLSSKALRVAQAAEYAPERVSELHRELVKRSFTRRGKGLETHYEVKPAIRETVVFRQLNLSRPPFPLKGPLDVVMCRNVMIYFDKAVREALLGEMYRLLAPGGYLLVGHAESLSGLRGGFVPLAPSIYSRS